MSDVNILYAVTGVVLAALLVWAGIVNVTAKDAPDESPRDPGKGDPKDPPRTRRTEEDEEQEQEKEKEQEGDKKTPEKPESKKRPSDAPPPSSKRLRPGPRAQADETPPPATVDVTAPSERAVSIGGMPAPVVVLPVIRSRLDSHREIRDDGSEAGGEEEGEPGEPVVTAGPAMQGVVRRTIPPPGPPLSLSSAIGRSEPEGGSMEMSAIIDRHHLFVLADGSGQRVQNELVSAVMLNALAAAFEADADDAFPADPTLPARADRLRRSVLCAGAVLTSRREEGLDVSRVGVLAAHFSPDNRTLYVVTDGRDRAYRLRGSEVLHLNKASLAAGDGGEKKVGTVVSEVQPEDVFIFASDAAFLALGDELRTVLTASGSIERVAAHFVAAATRGGKSTGMTALVVGVR
jgi:serine/threonine protein phosphatase PrpC